MKNLEFNTNNVDPNCFPYWFEYYIPEFKDYLKKMSVLCKNIYCRSQLFIKKKIIKEGVNIIYKHMVALNHLYKKRLLKVCVLYSNIYGNSFIKW